VHKLSSQNCRKEKKALTTIEEKRTATIAKLQKNLAVFKTALEKAKNQKESEGTRTNGIEPNI